MKKKNIIITGGLGFIGSKLTELLILIDVINNKTVIIVSYKSRKTILNCLKSLKQFKKILILYNSNDKRLKGILKKNYLEQKFFYQIKIMDMELAIIF